MSAAAGSTSLSKSPSLYPYEPSRIAATVFYVLLALSTIVHIIQVWRFKFWKVTGFLPWAGIVYTAGFITRMVSSYHANNLGVFLSTILLIFLAPPIYAAVNYFILGRMLGYIPYLSPIHPGRVVTTYVALDTLVEILTGQGASRVSRFDDPKEQKIGVAFIKAALILLLALYCSFAGLQVWFHRRCVRANAVSPSLRGIMNVLYVSNVLVLIRNIYRVIDTFLGFQGYTESHEWCLYVFEATPMLINSCFLNMCYPAIFLPEDHKVYLSQDGHTERRGPGFQDKRPFIVTLIDPFDVVGLAQGKDNKNRFWEDENQWPVVKPEEKAAAVQGDDENHRSPIWGRIIDPFDISRRLVKSSKEAETTANA